MQFHGLVGPSTNNDESSPFVRLGNTNELIFTKKSGKYAEQTLRGNVFLSYSLAITMEVYASFPTVPTTVLYNPPGSTRVLSLIRAEWGCFTALPTSPVVGTYSLYATVVTNPKSITTGNIQTVFPALAGSSAKSAGFVLVNPTLTANPVLLRNIHNKMTGTSDTAYMGLHGLCEPDGTILIPPGYAISLAQDTADGSNLSVIAGWVWEEIDL